MEEYNVIKYSYHQKDITSTIQCYLFCCMDIYAIALYHNYSQAGTKTRVAIIKFKDKISALLCYQKLIPALNRYQRSGTEFERDYIPTRILKLFKNAGRIREKKFLIAILGDDWKKVESLCLGGRAKKESEAAV
nr:hypothetical protein 24 [Candidatus Omnitrophota bacterium]